MDTEKKAGWALLLGTIGTLLGVAVSGVTIYDKVIGHIERINSNIDVPIAASEVFLLSTDEDSVPDYVLYPVYLTITNIGTRPVGLTTCHAKTTGGKHNEVTNIEVPESAPRPEKIEWGQSGVDHKLDQPRNAIGQAENMRIEIRLPLTIVQSTKEVVSEYSSNINLDERKKLHLTQIQWGELQVKLDRKKKHIFGVSPELERKHGMVFKVICTTIGGFDITHHAAITL